MADLTTIGGYTLEEQLGRGGMGTVYRARQASLGRAVAVKLMHPNLASDPSIVERFRVEAIAGGRLSHPNVVRMIDFGHTAEGTPYIAMEHVPGERLGVLLDREGTVSVRRACLIVRQVLDALAAAHAVGIVHADVKTDNLIVGTTRDGADLVTLIDFGIARLLDQPTEDMDDQRLVSGTPDYLAPEVIAGGVPTPAADIYAAGVLLYELIAGRTPFHDDDTAAILRHHLDDDVVTLSLRCPDAQIPAALDRLIMRALAKEPSRRPASAAQFASALIAAMPARDSIAAPFEPRAVGEAPTLDWPEPVRRRVAVGTRPQPHRLGRLRSAVGAAIALGDTDSIAAAYLALARGLVSDGQPALAAWELEQGVDVLTAGDGPDTPRPAPALWRVLLVLASIYDGQGDRVRAGAVARSARASATRVASDIGCVRARDALRRYMGAAVL